MTRPAIVVRPHPHAAQKHWPESACRQFGFVHLPGEPIERADLRSASRFSLSMASTVSLESIVLGTPTAFYQTG